MSEPKHESLGEKTNTSPREEKKRDGFLRILWRNLTYRRKEADDSFEYYAYKISLVKLVIYIIVATAIFEGILLWNFFVNDIGIWFIITQEFILKWFWILLAIFFVLGFISPLNTKEQSLAAFITPIVAYILLGLIDYWLLITFPDKALPQIKEQFYFIDRKTFNVDFSRMVVLFMLFFYGSLGFWLLLPFSMFVAVLIWGKMFQYMVSNWFKERFLGQVSAKKQKDLQHKKRFAALKEYERKNKFE